MAKSAKTKTPKEVKPKTLTAKENGKAAPKDSTAKAAMPEKSKSKDKGKGKAKAVELEPILVSPVEDEDEWEDEEELDEDEAMATASSDQEPANDSEEDDEDEEDDDGVDEEGMERLLKALGEDGLDDFDKAQIMALNGTDSDEEERSGEEGSEDEGVGDEGASDDEEEDQSASEEEEDEEENAAKAAKSKMAPQAADDGDEEDDEAIPLDEADDSVDEDAVPRRKVEIDNKVRNIYFFLTARLTVEFCKVALERIRETIALDPSLPWTETLAVTYPHTIEVDVTDDLNREVAFYKQALHCANEARKLAAKHKLPFTRPSDYFAEMVKSDSHMERIRQRLLNESASIKLSEDKKKQREGKKFGKQVQMEKLKERERSKKELDEKIKGLKRKRKDMLSGDGEDNVNDDQFDVAVENAISDNNSRPNKKSKMSRQSRDKKFGFGKGTGRFAKQNTRESTDSFGGPGKGKGKGKNPGGAKKAQRPGKSKRMNARNK
ncbi:hypothetical protein EST38_g1764 [Candolleomyces aberdarensis]|uniref:Uncharacterized protein n=1 Tax=Candolleomyces aberdarensis TaxID=2316362 RepID=A0A4Q2DV92_9AGAR|nr:hypothetical protein EST38_g1764 [Candolleomyces aberdarensis]